VELTGLILFIGSSLGMVYWVYDTYRNYGTETAKRLRRVANAPTQPNLVPGILLFIAIAVSAGMVWG